MFYDRASFNHGEAAANQRLPRERQVLGWGGAQADFLSAGYRLTGSDRLPFGRPGE